MTTTTRQKAAISLLAGLSLTGALAGCTAVEPAAEADPSPAAETPQATETAAPVAASTYVDGTYTQSGSYQTPNGTESVDVTITLEKDVITAVAVTGSGGSRDTQEYQGQFIAGIAAVVVGQDIDQLAVSKVAGSSLTSGGFSNAVEAIKADAL